MHRIYFLFLEVSTMKGKKKNKYSNIANRKRGPQNDLDDGARSFKKSKSEEDNSGSSDCSNTSKLTPVNIAKNENKRNRGRSSRNETDIQTLQGVGENASVSEQSIEDVTKTPTTPVQDILETSGRSRRKITPTSKLLNFAGKSGRFEHMLGRKNSRDDQLNACNAEKSGKLRSIGKKESDLISAQEVKDIIGNDQELQEKSSDTDRKASDRDSSDALEGINFTTSPTKKGVGKRKLKSTPRKNKNVIADKNNGNQENMKKLSQEKLMTIEEPFAKKNSAEKDRLTEKGNAGKEMKCFDEKEFSMKKLHVPKSQQVLIAVEKIVTKNQLAEGQNLPESQPAIDKNLVKNKSGRGMSLAENQTVMKEESLRLNNDKGSTKSTVKVENSYELGKDSLQMNIEGMRSHVSIFTNEIGLKDLIQDSRRVTSTITSPSPQQQINETNENKDSPKIDRKLNSSTTLLTVGAKGSGIVSSKSYNYLQCSCCFADFGYYRHLQLHIQSHHKCKSYICFKCGLGLTALDDDIDRIKLEHINTCKQNEKTFIYACNECNERFGKKRLVLLHDVLEHLGYSQLSYVCDICYTDQLNEEQFQTHYKDCVFKKFQSIFQTDGYEGIQMLNEKMDVKYVKMDDTEFMENITRKVVKNQDKNQASPFKGKPSAITKDVNIKDLSKTYIGKLFGINDLLAVLGIDEENYIATDASDVAMFLCTICGKRWNDYTEFFLHLTDHPGLFPFICLICGEGSTFKTLHQKFFAQNEHADFHEKNYENMFYICNYCPKRFMSSQLKHLHRRFHKGKGLFVCRNCKEDFITSQSYFQHQCPKDPNGPQTHLKYSQPQRLHSKSKILGRRKKRGLQYDKFAGLRRKIRVAKRIVTNPQRKHVECPVCKMHFKFGSFMCEHSRDKTFTGASVCHECGKIFKTSFWLLSHSQREHNKDAKCSVCNKIFSNRVDLREHMSSEHMYKPLEANDHDYLFSHETTEEDSKRKQFLGMKSFISNNPSEFIMKLDNKYVCIKCGKIYTGLKEKHILKHVRMEHLEEKRDTCKQCNKRFVFKSDLKRHIELHHGEKIRCRLCFKLLSSKHTYVAHMKICHKKDVSLSQVFHKLECNLCLKRFTNAKSLLEHKTAKHTCEICGIQKTRCRSHKHMAHGRKKKKGAGSNKSIQSKSMDEDKAKSLKTDEAIAFIQQQLEESPMKALLEEPCSSQNFLTSTTLTSQPVQNLNIKIERSDSNDSLDTNEGTVLICEECGVIKPSEFALKEHLMRVHGPLQFKCNLCEVVCSSKGSATIHRKKYHRRLTDNTCFTEISRSPRISKSSTSSPRKVISVASVSEAEDNVEKSPAKDKCRSAPSTPKMATPSSPKVVTISINHEEEKNSVTKRLKLDHGTKSSSGLDSEEEESRIATARKYLSPVKRFMAYQSPNKPLLLRKDVPAMGSKSTKVTKQNVVLSIPSPKRSDGKDLNESDSEIQKDAEVYKDGNSSQGVTESDALLLHHFGSINRNLTGSEETQKDSSNKPNTSRVGKGSGTTSGNVRIESNVVAEPNTSNSKENTKKLYTAEHRIKNSVLDVSITPSQEEVEKLAESKLIDDINASLVEKEVVVEANIFEGKDEATFVEGDPFADLGQVIQVIEEIPENIDIDNIISNNVDKTFKMSTSSPDEGSRETGKKKKRRTSNENGSDTNNQAHHDTKDKSGNARFDEKKYNTPVHRVIDVPKKLVTPYQAMINLPDQSAGVFNAVVNLPDDVKSVNLTVANMDNDDENVYLLFAI